MAERIKVTEAVRRTGVPGDVIFLAIRHAEISSQRDDRGYDWVDPDEVARSGGSEVIRGHWYPGAMDDASPVVTFEELAEAVRSARSPTPDDVSITWDGRRLDSLEKVLSFLAELDAARSSGIMVGPPLS